MSDPLDLEPIKARLAKPEFKAVIAECGPDAQREYEESVAHFNRHAPADIAALIAEVERLRAGLKAIADEEVERSRAPWVASAILECRSGWEDPLRPDPPSPHPYR